jgi:hypothetical protein
MLADTQLSHLNLCLVPQSTTILAREPQGIALSEHRVPMDRNDEDYEEFEEDQITELHMAAEDGHQKDGEALLGAHAHPDAKTSSVGQHCITQLSQATRKSSRFSSKQGHPWMLPMTTIAHLSITPLKSSTTTLHSSY